jgi:hypothetical protein
VRDALERVLESAGLAKIGSTLSPALLHQLLALTFASFAELGNLERWALQPTFHVSWSQHHPFLVDAGAASWHTQVTNVGRRTSFFAGPILFLRRLGVAVRVPAAAGSQTPGLPPGIRVGASGALLAQKLVLHASVVSLQLGPRLRAPRSVLVHCAAVVGYAGRVGQGAAVWRAPPDAFLATVGSSCGKQTLSLAFPVLLRTPP